jgi:hypothetical protein
MGVMCFSKSLHRRRPTELQPQSGLSAASHVSCCAVLSRRARRNRPRCGVARRPGKSGIDHNSTKGAAGNSGASSELTDVPAQR